MTVFEKFKTKNIDELIDWLDEYGVSDYSPWIMYFDKNYCAKCEGETVYFPNLERECDCAWCEVNHKCRFFKKLDDIPDNKQMIRIWLESEG